MKGNENVINTLNELLAEELTATNQYVVHSEMCKNWGYERLHESVEKRAIFEMRHAESLIERILFLEGTPIVTKLNAIHIGPEIEQQFRNDLEAEQTAVRMYNSAIKQAVEASDNGTREMLDKILHDEEEHADWLEAQLDQISQIGIQNYLAGQIRS
jgi:bacterioferritin